MSLFDDAAAFMKNRQPETQPTDGREEIIKRLRAEFENATRLEIEHALDKLTERGGIPDSYDELLKKIRIWLED